MANILDYLDWRGDLQISERGFNEVDNLLLEIGRASCRERV